MHLVVRWKRQWVVDTGYAVLPLDGDVGKDRETETLVLVNAAKRRLERTQYSTLPISKIEVFR